MQRIIDAVGEQAGLPEILANYGMFKSIPEDSQFAVIKVGGALLADREQRRLIADYTVALHEVGLYPVIVTGAGPQLDEEFQKNQIHTPKHNGIRVTPKEASPGLTYVSCQVGGELNTEIQRSANRQLDSAKDISEIIFPWRGIFSGTLSDPEDIGSVDVLNVYTKPIVDAIRNRIIPIVSSVGRLVSGSEVYAADPDTWNTRTHPESARDFQPTNINADRAAGLIAAKLGVRKYVALTETGAVLDTAGQPISVLDSVTAEEMMISGVINGGMLPKVMEALHLIREGVGSVAITSPENLLTELFTDKGKGTYIK